MAEIALPESLDIACTGTLRERLLAMLETGEPVTVNAAQVLRVDTAGVQLLTAFMRDARGRNLSVTLETTSGVLDEAARRLGLGDQLV